MSDADLSPETGTVETGTEVAPVENQPTADPFDSGADQFDRPYVERLRREAAEHRTSAKPYKDAFDGYSSEEQEVLLTLVRNLAADPKTAATDLERIVQNIKEAFPDAEPEPEADATPTAGMTKAEIEKFLEERDAGKARQHAEDTAVAEITSKAKDLGYEEGTADYIKLLWLAKNKTDYSLDDAHKMIEDERQSIIDKYLEGKEPGSVRARQTGTAPSGAKTPSTWDESFDALQARLKGTPGQ